MGILRKLFGYDEYKVSKRRHEVIEKKFNLWMDTIINNIPENISSLIFKLDISNDDIRVLLKGANLINNNYDNLANNFDYSNNIIFTCNTNQIYKDNLIESFIVKYFDKGKYSDKLKQYDVISMLLPNGLVNILYLNRNIENKTDKLEKIKLSKILHIDKIIDEYKFEEFINFSIGYDNKIYLLFIKNNKYLIMSLLVNWNEYRIVRKETTETNVVYNGYPIYYFIKPLPNGFLLSSSSLNDEKSTYEPNAFIINPTGTIINSICLGDAIQDLTTTNDGKIIVSYGAEGIKNPFSIAGMNIFDNSGQRLYITKKLLYDTNIYISDKGNKLYYYDGDENIIISNYENGLLDENIIISNYKNELLIESRALRGHYSDFLINSNNENSLLLFPQDIFYELRYVMKCKIDIESKKIIQEKFLIVTSESDKKFQKFNCKGSKFLGLTNNNILYGYEFK